VGVAYHTLYTPDGAGVNLADRIVIGSVTVTYASGSAGAAVTTAVSWAGRIPTPYTLLMSCVEDCTYYATSRTYTSLSLVVAPRLAANSLAGGTVELLFIS
jgi:hypothetical protein